ncbi:MAG: hypothetical protein JKY52_15695 [Flavobacteriales bacterium]|nr:hypothetical protein [Flavobacteriales bacterium]
MKLDHTELVDLLQRAYSAEKAAAFAYIGHAASVRDRDAKASIRQIELDEWIFSWGNSSGFNDVDLGKKYSIEASKAYCKKH